MSGWVGGAEGTGRHKCKINWGGGGVKGRQLIRLAT